MRELYSDIEHENIGEEIEIIPVFSTTVYRDLFSETVRPITGVWKWFSGLTVQWESGANVELE